MSAKKKDWKYIMIIVILSAITTLYYIFDKQVMAGLKLFFQFKGLSIAAATVSALITLVFKLKTKKYKVSGSMSFNDFKDPIEDLLSFIGNPITIVCSLSLAKGLFLQEFGNELFFPMFNGLERMFLAIITAYLLFTSIMQLINQFKIIVNQEESGADVPQAISESTFKKQTDQ